VFGVFACRVFLAVSRLGLLSLIDASSFPAHSSRYVYAAVPRYGCAALLLIEQAARSLRRNGAGCA
jgi:hypothetical protein